MVVDRHGHIPLGGILPDDILVEELLDLRRLEQFLHLERSRRRTPSPFGGDVVVDDDLIAVLDTFVTDIRAVRTLEHDLHVRALGAAERAAVAAVLVVVLILCHAVYLSRLESTSSISP